MTLSQVRETLSKDKAEQLKAFQGPCSGNLGTGAATAIAYGDMKTWKESKKK